MLKLYLKVIVLVALIISVLGFIAPALISASSTEATLLGIAICVFVPVVTVLLIKNIIKNIIKQISREEK